MVEIWSHARGTGFTGNQCFPPSSEFHLELNRSLSYIMDPDPRDQNLYGELQMERFELLTENVKRLMDRCENGEIDYDHIEYAEKRWELDAQWQAIGRCRELQTAQAVTQRPSAKAADTLYSVRISLNELSFEQMDKIMQKLAKRHFIVKSAEFCYVYEQTGVDKQTRGKNPHLHLKLRSNIATAGRLVMQIKKVHKFIDEQIEVRQNNNVNALRQYMAGKKGDPSKAKSVEEAEKLQKKFLATEQDKFWRIDNGLKMIYIIKNH